MVKDDSKMSDTKLTRAGSVKPKLSPRRDFGPAQDFPRRQYSLKATSGSSPGGRPNLRGIRKKRATTSAEDVLITILSPKVILDTLQVFLSFETFLCFNSKATLQGPPQQSE